jgi:7-cyano-7-deazaguanine synthase
MPKALAIVLSSGGLHSLVTAMLASREYRVGLVHIQDGRVTAKQAQAAFEKQVAHFKPIKSWIIDATYLRGMTLPPETAGLIHSSGSDPHSNLLPLRDLQFLSIGAGIARQMHASTLLWGIQYEQKQADLVARNMEFVQMVNALLELQSAESPVTVKTPLMGLEDHQVIELGYQMAVPFGVSWTCQMPLEHACMSCPACVRRMRAFRGAQLTDPLSIKTKPAS